MADAAPTTKFGRWRVKRRRKLAIQLDALGPRLLAERPWLGRFYARLLAPRPTLRVFPGWTFGREFFVEHRWMATRRGVLWRHALRNGLDVRLVLPWHARTRVEVALGNDESFCVYVAGSFEPNEFAFLDRTVRRGMTFLDVGANDGLYTMFAARRVGRRGRVLAVEPSSRERRVLERNIALNRLRNVVVVASALADQPGQATLQIAPTLHGGHNTLGGFAHKGVDAVASEQVQVETLDAVVVRLGIAKVDVIKIDVEGAELKVLEGARDVLRSSRPLLLIEANDDALRKQEASTADLLALLRSVGYAMFVFSETSGLEEPWAEGSPLSANIVAKPLTPPGREISLSGASGANAT
jgi:FkbM family methyltransferase